MKKRIFSMVLLALFFYNVDAQCDFYFANNQRQHWQEDSTSVNIIVTNMQNYDLIVRNLQTLFSTSDDTVWCANDDNNIIVISDRLRTMNLSQLLRSVSPHIADISFASYSKKINGRRLWLRNEAYVKLKNDAFYSSYLLPFLSNYRDYTIEYDSEENDYKITCNKEIDMLKIANGLYDTQYVYYSSPDFYSEMSLNTTDTYYGDQWALNNIGQEGGEIGVDVKAEKAWEFLQYYNDNLGDSIRVAVIDAGVEGHEDLNDASGNSRVKKGYPSWWGQGTPYDSYQWHGQACAGIIAASHNSVGMAGIAPNSLIVPIRIQRDTNTFFSAKRIQKAITKAWETYNAQILSNSWGGECSDFITYGFQKAMQDGRNGKGCVVVVSSGNNCRSYVEYPASITGVIAVGATDRCGLRAGNGNYGDVCERWGDSSCSPGSSYGSNLSVVAPGTHVYTIDRMGSDGLLSGNYNPDFNGTSAACPHVAGVAALILSVNPNLTHSQVKEIIEKTAQKVGPYNYTISDAVLHPNGRWNEEMGYGLVNAFHALAEAKIYGTEYAISGPSSMQLCNEYTYTLLGDVPEGYEIVWETNLHLCIVSGQGTGSLVVRSLYPATGNRIKVKICYDGYVIREKEIYPIASSGTGIYPVTNQDTVIRSNVLWDIERSLGNVVTIDSGAVLTITSTIHCTDNARLVVRPGGKLVVDGGTLTSACAGEMWQGVQVLGNSGLSQNAANQGWLELKNGAMIENARCAVQAEAGAVVKATNTAFRDNGRAVNLMPYVETMPGGGVRGNLSGFGNCTFTTDGDNLFSENGCEFTEHVRMSEVNGIEFHSCSFSDATAGGFTTHRGIYAQDAGFTLTKTCPSNIVFTDCVCAESYSQYNTFSGFNTAIEANTSGNQYAIEIDQTRFSGNGTAVRINGNNFVTVTRDTFDLTQSCSQPPFVTGLYLNNCSGYKVEGNHFKGLVMANVGSTMGVIVNNSGSADNTIYRNSFSSLNYGVQVRGDNGGADGGLQVACGSFSNVNNTIYLAGGATMKSTDNVTINNCASTLCGITPGFPGHPFPVNAAGTSPTNSAGADGHQALQTEVYYAAVRGIMADTVVDLGALQQWHTVAQPIADRYSLTETDFQMGLVDDVDGGDADYAQFHAMKAQLRDGEMVNWRDMTEAQKAELQEIAEHNSGRASEMAKGVLCFYHGICLEDGDLSAEEPQGGTKSAKAAINNADNAGLYVYPNPTDGELNVEITDGTQITAITLCDLQGRVVETQNFASQHGASLNGGTTVITMQNIPAGVYILTVTDLNGVIYHQKIIKK